MNNKNNPNEYYLVENDLDWVAIYLLELCKEGIISDDECFNLIWSL